MSDEGTAKVTITGVDPKTDGEYELDVTRFTGDEAHLIKQVAGVRLNELTDALEAGDYDLIVAFALIALERAGKKTRVEVLRAADLGSIVVDAGEGDAGPPDEDLTRSGESSSSIGGPLGNGHSSTGTPGSPIGSPESPQTTSVG